MNRSSNPIAKKVLFIGWDGADWQIAKPLMDAGRMPNLLKFVERGVMGNNLTLQPVLSPILWTSIGTGKRAYAHGIHGFVEPLPDGTGLRPTASTSRTTKAIWNIVSQAGLRCHAVNWYVSHPAERINGICVSSQFSVAPPHSTPESWSVAPASVTPPEVADQIADLRMHPNEIAQEYIGHFIPDVEHLRLDRPAVRHLVDHLKKRIAEMLTVHAVTTDLMENRPWDFCTVYYETIDQLGHDFMYYHPPKMAHLPNDVFYAFQHVMSRLYEFHDQMLGRLLELAGPDCHVIIASDHGFLNGDRRPSTEVEAAQWHRNLGMIAMAGAGLKQDALLQGTTLLDIAPTILAMLGLPVGRDMEGKVLVNAFEFFPQIERINSWDEIDDPNALAMTETEIDDPTVAAEAMKQLIELGYIEAPGDDVLRDMAKAKSEQRYNLASSLLDGRRSSEAVEITGPLLLENSDDVRFAVLHGQAAVPAGDTKALSEAIAVLEKIAPDNRNINLFRGFIATLQDQPKVALDLFRTAAEAQPEDAWLQARVGRACLRLRQWNDATTAFKAAQRIDPENAEAAYGLSVALARLGHVDDAIEQGLRAIGLLHDFPLAHFQLGAMLARSGEFERAAQAFEICLTMRPHFALAHRYLARIHERVGNIEQAYREKQLAAQLIEAKVPQPAVD